MGSLWVYLYIYAVGYQRAQTCLIPDKVPPFQRTAGVSPRPSVLEESMPEFFACLSTRKRRQDKKRKQPSALLSGYQTLLKGLYVQADASLLSNKP